MSRDWQKDRQYIEMVNDWESGMGKDDIDQLCEIASYWHQEAKFWQDQYDSATDDAEETERELAAEKERADQAEAREQKLQELLKDAIGCMMAYDVPARHRHRIESGFRSLYPKEEEAK